MKLIYQKIDEPTKCEICIEVDRKLRKRSKIVENIQKMEHVELKKPDSIEIGPKEITKIDEELKILYQELTHRRVPVGWSNERRIV